MKNFVTTILFLFFSSVRLFGQSCVPDYIHLTAVARDSNSTTGGKWVPVTTAIDIQVELYKGDPNLGGTKIYCERVDNKVPNSLGEFSLDFGTPTLICNPPAKLMNTVLWQTCDLWYKLSWRKTGQPNFIPIAVNKFSSVPYAFASRTAEKLITPGATIGQILTWNGTDWLPANPSINFTAGSGIKINAGQISADDNSPTNEIQQISITNNKIDLSNGGGSITLPTYSAGTGIDITNNVITNTVPEVGDYVTSKKNTSTLTWWGGSYTNKAKTILSSSPKILTEPAPASGYYLIIGRMIISTANGVDALMSLHLNNYTQNKLISSSYAGNFNINIAYSATIQEIAYLNKGDQVELQISNDNAGAFSFGAAGDHVSMVRIK